MEEKGRVDTNFNIHNNDIQSRDTVGCKIMLLSPPESKTEVSKRDTKDRDVNRLEEGGDG